MTHLDAHEEVLALMREHESRPLHVLHVARLALQLFDGLGSLHLLGPRERVLLEAAGLLHDIGHRHTAAAGAHHKESARLIREHPWEHFSPSEVEIIAQVARYHRRSMPEFSHEEFRNLPDWDRRAVQSLAALLRLADAFDRSKEQLIQSVTVTLSPTHIILLLDASSPVTREVKAARQKGDLASLVFQRDLLFVSGEQEMKIPA